MNSTFIPSGRGNFHQAPSALESLGEFQAQGLELDAALLAWGTDRLRQDGAWSNVHARGYKRGAKVRDPSWLRVNAYRVLLTRARDVSVVCVPPLAELDETYEHLGACGFRPLARDGRAIGAGDQPDRNESTLLA